MHHLERCAEHQDQDHWSNLIDEVCCELYFSKIAQEDYFAFGMYIYPHINRMHSTKD